MSNKPKEKFKTSIGGQALIEGIMMRGPEKTAMAVRKKDGEIYLETMDISIRKWYSKVPVLRGILGLGSSLMLGYKCLMKSAEISGFAEEDEEESTAKEEIKGGGAAVIEINGGGKETSGDSNRHIEITEEQIEKGVEKEASNFEKWLAKTFKIDIMTVIAGVAMIFALGLSMVLFVLLPTLAGGVVRYFTHSPLARSLTEAAVRMIIFIGYIALVALMPDIRRVFEYHGAEHKTITCYESGLELTVENIRPMSRLHPRCGTSFLFLVIIISIFVSLLVPIDNVVLRAITKIFLMLPVAGVSNEIIRFVARHDNPITRMISKPGMWLQNLTTKEPDDSAIEVAIVAMNEVIPKTAGSDYI